MQEMNVTEMQQVSGGLLPALVIVGLALADIYIWGKVYDKYF
jgi:lactobin A/cerein 7B family class IIb bacteriocin